jgi:hypothetical protein
LRDRLPEIRAAIARLLTDVRARGLDGAAREAMDEPARVGWL